MLPLFILYLLRQECHNQPCHNGKATLVQQASEAQGLVVGYSKPLALNEIPPIQMDGLNRTVSPKGIGTDKSVLVRNSRVQ